MRIVYRPQGGALEYAELAASLYWGCVHSCRYCFCPRLLRTTPEKFHRDVHPRPDALKHLEADLKALQASGAGGQIHMSFSTDPYQPMERAHGLTRAAIELCHRHGFGARILTKGGKLAERDFDLLGPRDAFGVSYTTISAEDAAKWEPGAAPPHYRLMTIRHANTLGIPTWVSLEPVFDPESALYAIQAASLYADEIKIGRWNHSKEAGKIDWRKFAADASALCERLGVKYVLKAGLRELV